MVKIMELKTKRLRIIPLSIKQMELLCEGRNKLTKELGLKECLGEDDEHLLQAYKKMYQQCLENKKDYQWHTAWLIVIKEENRSIGSIGFFGRANKLCEVEIGYGIDEKYRGCGYAAEAVDKLCEWAFFRGVYFVQARCESENIASEKALLKSNFKKVCEKDGMMLFEKEKPNTSWMTAFIGLGMCIGIGLGITVNNITLGSFCGLAIGVAIGTAIDEEDKKKRRRQ